MTRSIPTDLGEPLDTSALQANVRWVPDVVEERIRATAALLAEPSRVELLTRLVAGPSYPSDLATALGLSAQSVSKHLTRLRSGGLVATHREGRRIRYEVAGPQVARLLHDLGHLSSVPPHTRGARRRPDGRQLAPTAALTIPAPTEEPL